MDPRQTATPSTLARGSHGQLGTSDEAGGDRWSLREATNERLCHGLVLVGPTGRQSAMADGPDSTLPDHDSAPPCRSTRSKFTVHETSGKKSMRTRWELGDFCCSTGSVPRALTAGALTLGVPVRVTPRCAKMRLATLVCPKTFCEIKRTKRRVKPRRSTAVSVKSNPKSGFTSSTSGGNLTFSRKSYQTVEFFPTVLAKSS